MDWFAAELTASQVYGVAVVDDDAAAGLGSQLIGVYDADGALVSAGVVWSGTSGLSFTPLVSGTYHVSVAGTDEATGGYTVSVSEGSAVVASGGDSDDDTDGTDDTDTTEDVTPAPLLQRGQRQSQGVPGAPGGLLTAVNHNTVLLFWDDPDDDSITGYQVLRGPDADNLSALVDDTSDANPSYTDSRVAAQTSYTYAIKARNAHGLGPQSDPVTVTTLPAPEEDEPPTSARLLAGADFTLDGQALDTTASNCLEDTIGDITADCTIDIDTTTATFAVVGTLDSDDRLTVKIGRDKAAVDSASTAVDQGDLRGTGQEATLTFQVGRNLLRLWGDEDGTSGGGEEHFYRVNVVPYWELSGARLSKSDGCRSATARTAAQITDDDCIVTLFGKSATIRFYNVITAQFNVYVYLNGTRVINEPDNTALAASFPLNLQDGDNAVRVRLAAKAGGHHAETYDSDRFHYKVTPTDILVTNLGRSTYNNFATVGNFNGQRAIGQQFTTGAEQDGYLLTGIIVDIGRGSSLSPEFAIHANGSSGTVDVPGDKIQDLSGSLPVAGGQLSFTPDRAATLRASTKYWLVLKLMTGSDTVSVAQTISFAEDPGYAQGWSIADGIRGSNNNGATWSARGHRPIRFAVKGEVVVELSDARLSALALTDASNNAIALSPAFASGATSYTAAVVNSVSRIKLQPTANVSNATIEYLDDSDATLADADTSTADVFDFVLDIGANVVKVKVTAEDSTTTLTYTIKIRRAEADLLVSNAGSVVDEGSVGVEVGPHKRIAIRFSTGNHTGVYEVDKVRLNISAESGTIPRVSIYSNIPFEPDASLKQLANPNTVPTSFAWADFDAGDYRLASNTSYWIVIEKASGNGEINVRTTESTAQDAGTAAGWSIADRLLYFTSPPATWFSKPASNRFIPQMIIRGEAAESSTDATLSALALMDASDNAIALTPAFASGANSYITTVANSVSQIKVEPTATDSNATIEYLDDSDATLADADTSTADVFDFVLDVGDNVVKVKVTAEDGATTETYTIKIRRAEADLLVSNAGSVPDGDFAAYGLSLEKAAIQFTTGNHTVGYVVDTVGLRLSAVDGATPRVSIYSDSSGEPGASLKTLANPSTEPPLLAWGDFDAGGYRLAPNTSYWIVLERATGTGQVLYRATESTAEDAGTAEGWSIGDRRSSYSSSGAWSPTSGSRAIPHMVIRGAEAEASTDATLSALALADASDNAIALDPTFASATTSYTATVANPVSRIKVQPTATDSYATIEYLNNNDATLPDEDTGTAVFDFDLNVGSNVVKVKVTAEDGTTSETYTVTINRVDFLVSNLGQTVSSAVFGFDNANPSGAGAVRFTTGGNTGGYVISSVRTRITASSGIVVEMSIYSDSSGQPGSSLKVLDNPNTLPTGYQQIDFGAGNYRLDANTSYWVALKRISGSGAVYVSMTESTSEDIGSAAGWSIGDDVAFLGAATESWTTNTQGVVLIAIKGRATDGTLTNHGPTGAPIIRGTAALHLTLTALTTNIRDADGLTRSSFSYQWIRVDTDGSESEIAGAMSSTYRLTGDDVGKRLKVRVSFRDDNGNPEALTSAATAAVSPSPCTVQGALRFNGSLPAAIDVVIGDSNGTTVTLPSWSGPVCRALVYLGYSNSDDVDVFRGDGLPSITSVTFNGRKFSVDQETRELTIQTTSDLPAPWNAGIEFWDTLETYMLVPLDNWGATEQSPYQGRDFFVRFHNLAAPNLAFSRNGRTVRFSGGVDYSTDLFPGRPFNAGGYEIQRCDTSAGCTSDSDWRRVVRTANGQGRDWRLDRTDFVPSASSDYRYRARQHITLRHDGSTYYGPWSREVLLRE